MHWLKFSRAVLANLTVYLTMVVVHAADFTQPIRASPDGHFLTQRDGLPFFWLADTAWPLFVRLDREEADRYLHDRVDKGFTVIQAVIMCGPWEGLDAPNRYGQRPLIARDPSHPNPQYFEHVDWIVARAAHYGLHMALLPTWASGCISSWTGKGEVFNTTNARLYGRWLGRRYENRGIIWILGGDTNPLRPARLFEDDNGHLDKAKSDFTIIDYRPIYDAMAQGLKEGEGGRPLITYHPSDGSFSGTAVPRMSLYFGDRDWYGLDMLQSGHNLNPAYIAIPDAGYNFSWSAPSSYEALSAEYDAQPARPVIDGEARYEGEPVDILYDPSKGFWTAYDSRNAAYHAVFAGAAGHTYGNDSVHQLYDPARHKPLEHVARPWQEEIDSEGARQMQHLKALLLSRPYFTRIPDQSLLLGETGTGIGHISATRGKDGGYALIYLPRGRTVSIDMSKIAGLRAMAWWFDPRTGTATRMEGSIATTGTALFTPPTSGPQDDWVLVLDDASKGFAAPGASGSGATSTSAHD